MDQKQPEDGLSRKQRPRGLHLLRALGFGFAPLAFTYVTVAYFLLVARWIDTRPTSPAAWVYLFALPTLITEVLATRRLEVAGGRWRWHVLLGLGARLLFLGLLTLLFIHVPSQAKGASAASHWFAQDLTDAGWFLLFVWLSSPVPAVALALLWVFVYGGWTARRQHGRLTTTIVLPGMATVALFVLMYQFPDSAIRAVNKTRPDFVQRVWTRTSPDHRFPREVRVSADETHAVATFGSTFPADTSDPPENELGLDPARCDPKGNNPQECRRNLAIIDLTNGATRLWPMPTVRRFYSEDEGRFFVVPWNISELLEFGMDHSVRKHQLPQRIGSGELREVNEAYYASDIERVFLTSGNNPVIMSWSTRTGQLENVSNLDGWNGIAAGDTALYMARSKSRGKLYVTVKAVPFQLVELDEKTLQPLRSVQPGPSLDVQLSPDEQSIYTSSFFQPVIWRINPDTLKVEATIDAPYQTRRISLSPDGSLLFAAAYLSGDLVVYETRTNQKVDSFYVGPRLEGMYVAGGGLYLLSADGLYRVPLNEIKKRAAVQTGDSHGVADSASP